MYVVWSQDGGATWDGGGGVIAGSAKTPYLVNTPKQVGAGGTHFFPAIAAGDPGHVGVAYLGTPTILPTDPLGKADPGGCAGPGNGNPPTFPPACSWNLYAAESGSLKAGPVKADWENVKVTSTPMHIGDICNLGIACVAPSSNRNLLDFIQETVDPAGCTHIGYADDNTVNKLRVANQVSGPSLFTRSICQRTAQATAHRTTLGTVLPVGIAGAVLVGLGLRRRRAQT
jgi:hypothetical protein